MQLICKIIGYCFWMNNFNLFDYQMVNFLKEFKVLELKYINKICNIDKFKNKNKLKCKVIIMNWFLVLILVIDYINDYFLVSYKQSILYG